MTNRIALIFVIFASTLLCSCHKSSIDHTLELAETLMEQRPDSALTILSGIDGSSLRGELRARHALLLSQAYDKNYIDVDDDSLINIALDYYSSSTDNNYIIPSHYYKANVAYYANDIQTAIFYATMTDTLSQRAGNYHYRGLTNNLISTIYRQLGDFNKELEYAQKTYEFFKANHDSIRTSIALKNIATCYVELQLYETALDILESPDCSSSHYYKALCLVALNREDEYKAYINEHPELMTYPRLHCRTAVNLIKAHKYAEAESVIKLAYDLARNNQDSASCLIAKAQLLKATDRWKEYSELVLDANHKTNDILSEIFSIYDIKARLQANHYINNLETKRINRDRQSLAFIVMALVSILLIVLVSVVLWRLRQVRILIDKERLINLMTKEKQIIHNKAELLSKEVDSLQSEIKEIRFRYDSSQAISDCEMDDLYITINEIKGQLRALCDKYQHTSSNDSQSIKRLLQEIKSLLTPEALLSLEKYTDKIHSGIITKARQIGISDKDISILTLSCLDFSNSQMSLLLGLSYSSVASRKSRLFSKLNKTSITTE